jgi:hypothetical protein
MSRALAVAVQDGLGLSLLVAALAFGLRHGIDWDHIAAITDITSSQDNARKSLRFATLYAVGHGAVVLMLGLNTIEVGFRLPGTIDAVIDPYPACLGRLRLLRAPSPRATVSDAEPGGCSTLRLAGGW